MKVKKAPILFEDGATLNGKMSIEFQDTVMCDVVTAEDLYKFCKQAYIDAVADDDYHPGDCAWSRLEHELREMGFDTNWHTEQSE